MGLNKYSEKSDRIANLYRSAFYFAKGSVSVALEFLNKSGEEIEGLKFKTKKEMIITAEKILDLYKIRKNTR